MNRVALKFEYCEKTDRINVLELDLMEGFDSDVGKFCDIYGRLKRSLDRILIDLEMGRITVLAAEAVYKYTHVHNE